LKKEFEESKQYLNYWDSVSSKIRISYDILWFNLSDIFLITLYYK
jgi:hypothetical protein